MATLLGGKRWEEPSDYDFDHQDEEELTPLDDDWIPEEYRDADDD